MPHRPVTAAFINRLIAWRLPLLAVGMALAVASFLPARRLEFDQSIENMFASDDPLLAPYRRLTRTFGGNEVALAAYVDSKLLTESGIERLDQLTATLRKVPGVAAVQSLTTTPLGRAIADADNALTARLHELFEGYTVSDDRRIAAVICILKPKDQTDVPRSETVDQLRAVIDQYPGGTLAGEPVMIVDGFRYLEADGRLLMRLSMVLLAAVIVLCFRSLRWVLVPIAVVQVTIWMTQALLVALELQLSMVSSMLSAIITVVGVATVMHIVVQFREERGGGLSPIDAFRAAAIGLAAPVLSACLTDTVACSSLLLARVGPVQDFGLMTAIGLTLVLVSVVLLLPGLALTGRFDPDPKRSWGEDRLDLGLYRAIDTVERRPWLVGTATAIVAALGISGSLRLEIESDFTKNFRAGSPIVESYQMVEESFGGAGVWDLLLPAPAELDAAYLARVLRLEERLREVRVETAAGESEPGLTKVFSLADVVATVSPLSFETLARMPTGVTTTALDAMRGYMPESFQTLHAQDPATGQYVYRILLRSKERQPAAQKKRLIAEVQRIAQEGFPSANDQLGAQATGFFVLLTNLIDSLLRDQWITFAAATAGMWCVMLVVFRSPVLATLGLVPNVLPVFLMMGVLGWLGIALNMGAAVIAAFSMGLSVDSTVHYIVDFQRARQRSLSFRESLDAAQQSAGRAAFFATLALVVGFSALCSSEFVPTIYFGALTSLTMLFGLAGNLLVLPLLLRMCYSRRPL
ncbi:MAG: MMPL family transporter [Pirellulales bacterium]